MNKELPSPDPAKSKTEVRVRSLRLPKPLRAIIVALIVLVFALVPSLAPLAQRVKESQSPINVTGIGARQNGGNTVVTVNADGPLNRTQTWQEGDKFHLVLPYAGGQLRNLPRGVKVNRVGNSLEIVVNMKSGSSVTVDPNFNHLNLVVNGELNQTQTDADDNYVRQGTRSAEQSGALLEDKPSSRPARERNVPALSAPKLPFLSSRSVTANSKLLPSSSAPAQNQAAGSRKNADQTRPAAVPAASASPAANALPAAPSTSNAIAPAQDNSTTRDSSPAQDNSAAPPPAPPAEKSGGFFSMLFSTTGVVIMLAMGFLAFAFLRLRAGSREMDEVEMEEDVSATDKAKAVEPGTALVLSSTAPPAVKTEQPRGERRKSSRRKSDKLAASSAQSEQALEARGPAQIATQAVLFGAYRVDQEVGKLVLGQPHRMDVLASRAADDRRAIETSLLKALNAVETDEDGRRRARQALEEYGFLARHSAALLLAHDACERVAAAHTLGEIGAPPALPFLLEALYDADTTVRAQAVSSIGALRLPSAIGALLDTARRYPEIPASLLSQALNACSLECLEIDGIFETEHSSVNGEMQDEFNGEITRLEPSGAFEQLPEFLEDETLAEALERLENADVEMRTAAARRLAQFQTQSSVAALTALAARDTESVVRASAVASLGEIDHESVFATILMAFADEAREVQAAAARALSRLSFNRADAFVRIIETADEETLGLVARACIKARMASQAIERLASEDRRQAYEAFSLLSLLAKAGETAPLLDAITEHPDSNVQMTLIRLLGITASPEIARQFRQLVVRDGLPEKVRTALLEVVYKIDQALPV